MLYATVAFIARYVHVHTKHDVTSQRTMIWIVTAMMIMSQNLFLYEVKVDWISLISEWAVLERHLINPEIWNGISPAVILFYARI